MNLWRHLYSLIEASPQDEAHTFKLLQEYRSLKYLSAPPTELLDLPDNVIISFYYYLSLEQDHSSPVSHQPDSSWMTDASFCFINIRACGKGDSFGNILDAARILTGIRSSAIHLGPFTSYDFECIYAVSSVKTIATEILHPLLLEQGVSGLMQMQALVQAAHLLDKTIGFDLEPHVTTFSIPCLLHPQYFRWIHIDPATGHLKDNISYEDMISADYQILIHAQVGKLVQDSLREYHLSDLDVCHDEDQRSLKADCYHSIVQKLMGQGFWTIPVQSWKSYGIPAYKEFNFQDKHPVYSYISPDGEDVSHMAYNIVTPFAFHQGLTANKIPAEEVSDNRECQEFYSSIFSYWQINCDFDFVRFDSVDHIFDSCDEQGSALSDRPTPQVLELVIRKTKEYRASAGNLAERMGQEITQYASIGFDSLLGIDMILLSPREILENAVKVRDEIHAVNSKTGQKIALCMATDTHDTGNPGLIGASLIEKLSAHELAIRHFMSRFLNIGLSHRCKYEVMGYQDRSHGLFQSNVHNLNLNWTGDAEFNKIYHQLEDWYILYKDLMKRSHWKSHNIARDYCMWQFQDESDSVICIVNTGKALTANEFLPHNWMENTEDIHIYLSGNTESYTHPLNAADCVIGSNQVALVHFKQKNIYQRI